MRIFIATWQWQMRGESRPLSRLALDGEPAAMPIKDVLDQRKAKPGAALRTAFGDIDAIEPLRQPGQVLGAMPGP